MQKIKLLFTGFGFLWLFLWSILGSLIGIKLNFIAASGVHLDQVDAWQKKLLTQAHAHMNMMGITLILIALTLNMLRGVVSDRYLKMVCFVNLVSVILFGSGLVAEAFNPSEAGHISFAMFITTFGGAGYMFSMAIWGCFFFFSGFKKTP